ncbi:V-type ATPase 116kDa subunit family protein [uncultured Draconibacterium sp.]|uniref:V-type ATP synthase subunit I n=1 Tax=uncultured Draconibacterium sp. TaxID=1573823 RepID=UPI0032615F72
MIVPMLKYTFLVFYKEYDEFLHQMQKLGVLHVVTQDIELSEPIKQKYADLQTLEKTIAWLKKRPAPICRQTIEANSKEIITDLINKQNELEELDFQQESVKKAIQKALPWGNFSAPLIKSITNEGISLNFFGTTKKKFEHIQNRFSTVVQVSETGNQVLFVHINSNGQTNQFDAEPMQLPAESYAELEDKLEAITTQIKTINETLDCYAQNCINQLESEHKNLVQSLQFENILQNTQKKAEDKLMLLEGWVPKSKTLLLNHYLEHEHIVHLWRKARPGDKTPVLLRNNRFSKLFEPIGAMFSLPDYAELDLTVFFAPFFMMFFGFCLGDAGYGLLFLIGGGLYKLKAKTEIKPYLSLIQFLGVATILFGAISGTFFGINLITTELSLTAEIRHLFLNPDKMFNLSLILGGVQIIFGLFIKAANQTKQFGFRYALATCGWLIILIGSICYLMLSATKIIPENKLIIYLILGTGGFLIFFFSDPEVNLFARIGKGIWDVYSTVTGIFGDLLSYIRLFALGLSSAILGFVINDIGLQILGSSKILGPVFFVIFLLLGHTLNILISSLGSFVHPMRLTFVEFYKSAGFSGGGQAYQPFETIDGIEEKTNKYK